MIAAIAVGALATAAAIAGEVYDVTQTVKGIKAGLAVEQNTFLVGPVPSALALYLRDALWGVPCIAGPIAAVALQGAVAAPLFIITAIFGLRHYVGGRQWVTLASIPADKRAAWLVRPLTAWQKFLGE